MVGYPSKTTLHFMLLVGWQTDFFLLRRCQSLSQINAMSKLSNDVDNGIAFISREK